MDNISLVVQPRDVTGSRAARRLRRSGLIPGVLYGHGNAATLFSVEPRVMREALGGEASMHSVFDVTIEGQPGVRHVVIKEIDLDRARGVASHIDLQEIRLTEVIEASVDIMYEGESKGVKLGGIFDASLYQVLVKGVVTAIPEHIVFDISELDVNDSARVSDLTLPEGIQVLDDPDEVLCSVLVPRSEEEAGEEAVVDAQPEVIGKAKKDESAD